jgi:hypothetical protein
MKDMLRSRSLLLALFLSVAPPALAQVPQGPLVPADSAYAFDTNGQWLFTASPSSSAYDGEARVWRRGADGWSQTQTLKSPVPGPWSYGWDVAADGQFLAVGAPFGSPGKVHVYRLSAGLWLPFQELALPSFDDGSSFGQDLALTGERLLVSMAVPYDGFLASKRVQVFAFNGVDWALEGVLAPISEGDSWGFGDAMAVSGDLAVVGEPNYYPNSGRATIFRRGVSGWSPEQVLLPAVSWEQQRFGKSIAIHGGRVLVGAPGADIPGEPWGYDRGELSVYETHGSTWSLAETLRYFEPIPFGGQQFGAPLGHGGDWLAVGQTYDSYSPTGPAVHLYRHDGQHYALENRILGAEAGGSAGFAQRLAFDGSTLAVDVRPDLSSLPAVATFDTTALGSALQAWPAQLSLASGGTQAMTLAGGGAVAGQGFFVLGSLSGTSPGIMLGSVLLPLNPDAYLSLTTKLGAPIAPPLGTLGDFGQASAAFTLPAGLSPALVGATVHHAYLALDFAPLQFLLASNAVSLTLQP